MGDVESDGRQARSARMLAVTMVLASSALIAVVPNFAKLAYESGASVPFVVFGRFLIAVLLLGGALVLMRRRFSANARVYRLCAIAGIAGAAMSFGVLSSIARIDISLTLLIFYFHPVVIIWLGCARGTYTMTPARLFYCLAVVLGLVLALAVRFDSLDPLGIAFAFLAALGAAVLVIANVDAIAQAGSILVNFYTSVVALLLAGAACLFVSELHAPGTGVGWIGLLGAGSAFCLALALFLAAVPAIGMVRATLISVVEPLLAIFVAMAMFGERLTPTQWVGVGVVLAGLALLEVPPGRLSRLFGKESAGA